MNDRTLRWAGAAAIVFVVLILIGVFGTGSPPAADDAVAKMRTYYVDHRAAVLLGQLCGLLGIAFVVWFAVVLREAARGDRLANAFGTTWLAGLLVTAPMALAGGAVNAAAVYVDGDAKAYSDDTIRLIYEAQMLLFLGTAAGLALFMLAGALLIRRTNVLPAYTMWLALLGVVGNILTMVSGLNASISMLGLFGVLTFALFVLVTGITMAMGKTTVSTASV